MAKDRLSGKLAVILHADIAGSTQMVQLDERLAHERIQDSFHRFSATIKEYSGRVLELRGDALLAEFERPSDAVSATLAFQSNQSKFLSSLDDDLKPEVRVGIAMGEVVVADNTITGAGVVMAQRVEQLADTRGLCITAAVRESLPGRLSVELENLGQQELKGFEEPVGVYKVTLSDDAVIPLPEPKGVSKQPNIPWIHIGVLTIVVLMIVTGIFYWVNSEEAFEKPASIERVAFPLPDKPSIAVLPFANLSDDEKQEYFVDGMTEDLITDLSKISAITAISRMSSFSYKGLSPDVRTVSSDLGASHVVAGSVRKAGNSVRISVQLVDANGTHIWGDRYDRELKDIFALQDEVRSKIVAALAVELTPNEKTRLARALTTNVEAYDLYLQGLQQISFFSREANLRAQELFEQAINVDSKFAAAYAYLAQTYSLAIENEWTDNRDKTIEMAVSAAEKGITLDNELPFAYWSLGRIYSRAYLADMDKSIAAFNKSIDLDPNYADGYVMLGSVQIYIGQAEKALGNIEKGMRINPHFPFWYVHTLGQAQFALTRYEAAEQSFRKAITRNPAVGWPRRWLVATLGQLGKIDDAEWEISELEGFDQTFTIEMFKRRLPLKNPEYLNRLIEGCRKAGVPES